MRKKKLFILVTFSITVLPPVAVSSVIEGGVPGQKASVFVGQDLHLAGGELISYQLITAEHTLVLRDGFSMSIGANQFSSDSAVVWLRGDSSWARIDYKGWVYLQGNVSVKKGKGAETTDLTETVIEKGQSMVVRFGLAGEVFVTTGKREIAEARGLILRTPDGELYAKALAAAAAVEPKFVVRAEAMVPELPTEKIRPEKSAKEIIPAKPKKPGLIERIFALDKPVKMAEVVAPEPKVKNPRFGYPVNIAPVGEVAPKIESVKAPDGTDIATVIGRFYLWQKLDERGGLLELQADNAVMFSADSGQQTADSEEINAIYMSGDVVMTEGQRTIRADEIYYDFQRKKALAINAVMRNFDVSRGIPIYARAAKLRQIAENKFAAENIILTSSEFYVPAISLTASSVIITDTTTVDEQAGKVSDSSFDAQMRDVRLKAGDKTLFYWPFMRSNLQRPDIPLKSVHSSYDRSWGASVETQWYLSRLLGLRQPEWTDNTFVLDYHSKRGLGSGVEIDYARENYFGRLLGYIIHDTGEDRLGRLSSRRDLEPPRKLRGRFSWLHRRFLPYNWQLTTGINYESDERFVESFYRNEFNIGEDRQTYIHLKRLQDNWALSLLGKGRINDFADRLEELPSAEFHLMGKSLFDDRFTLYSDTQISRLRQRIGNDHSTSIDENMFSFSTQRTELDMPFRVEAFKIVPFVAGTFGYDDRSGFRRSLVDGSNTGRFGEDKVWIGEAGVRVGTQYWKEYRDVKSRLWDLKGLRHIMKPYLAAACYAESDSVVRQRDTLNLGVSQRLQTKRLRTQNSEFRSQERMDTQYAIRNTQYETVDWMRLDMDVTWVNNSDDSTAGPDRFIWNRPIVPLRVLSAPGIFHGDLENDGVDRGLRRFEMYGPRRNYFSADYIWRLSDATAVLSDMNFDMQSGVVQQFNVGISGLRWPNLVFYIGSRYLRRVEVLDEKGSNALAFAATYVLDPRYTVVFSQQFDFDYGKNCRSDITLIRRYHRIYCGLTYSADQSLSEQAIVFSIWPQGVPELGIGPRRYMGLGRY